MNRNTKALSLIDPAVFVGLEFGPLDRPIVSRDEGDVRYIDHATTDELREKYHDDESIDVGRLVDVDYVWDGKPLTQIVSTGQRFDYVIASHVAEHVPDLIGWLRDIREVLEDNGILSLVIPDRRYTFDYLREPTTTADLVDAYVQERTRPTPGQVFDHYSRVVHLDLDLAWNGSLRPDQMERKFTDEEAMAQAHRAQATDSYIDVHCWVFTPRSFFSALSDLVRLDLVDYMVAGFFHP